MEKHLQNREQLIEEIHTLDSLQHGCFELDYSGQVTFINRKAKELLKYPGTSLTNVKIWEIFPEAVNTGCFKAIQTALEKGESGQYGFLSPRSKKQVFLCASPIPGGCQVLFSDIEVFSEAKSGTSFDVAETLEENISLQNLKRLIDSSHDALISLDTDGVINYWNPAAEKMFKFSQEEVKGELLEKFIIPEGKKELLQQALKEVHEQGKSFHDLVSQKKDKNGRPIDVLVNIYPLRDEHGEIIGSCISMKDITEQKKAELKTKEEAHFISHIVDTTPDIIYIMDLNTRHVLYTNRQIAADLGYTKQQIAEMQNPVFDIMVEEDIPAMIDHLKHMKTISSDSKVVEIQYRMRNAKGVINWFCDRNAVFKRNERKIPVEKIGICQDITQRKMEEERMRTTLGIIQQSEQIASIGSWEYDINADEFKWSDGMYRLFNIDKETAVRPEIYLEFAEESQLSRANDLVDSILNKHSEFDDVITLLPPAQEKKLIKIKSVVQRDKQGVPVKIIGVDLDITQQVEAAEEINTLYKSLLKKNDELRQLDHEIKAFNIVAAKVYKETLQQLYTNLEYIVNHDARNLSDSGRANIRRAQSGIQRMNLITDDINTYFSLYDLEPDINYIDPNNLIQQVINEYAARLEQYDARIETATLPLLPVDARLFTKLISNLVGYAIKNRNPASPLVIKIEYSHVDEINGFPTAKRNTAYGMISLSHHGLGISDMDTEGIFDLFQAFPEKSKPNGPGVALAICKKIMNMHSGFIIASGSQTDGTRFDCYFPLDEKHS